MKAVILFISSLCCVIASVGQTTTFLKFNPDSIPFKKIESICGYHDSTLIIAGHNLANTLDDLLFYTSNLDEDIFKQVIINPDINQILTVGCAKRDAARWNKFFVVGYSSKKDLNGNYFITRDSLKTENGITLGLSIKNVLQLMGEKPSIIATKKDITILKYFYFDTASLRFYSHGCPEYVIAFKFQKGKLQRFSFGDFYDNTDSENFNLKAYKLKRKEVPEEFNEYLR